MKAHEMRELTTEELRAHLESLVEEYSALRVRLAIKQVDNPLRVRQLRREIARARTILRERELASLRGRADAGGGASEASTKG
jgi:large subunit ribosomal protein L29